MKVQQEGSALSVSDIVELAAANSGLLKSSLQPLLTPAVDQVEIDLGSTEFIDCAGAGALASVRRRALAQNPGVRFCVRPPRASLRRVFALTGLNNLFPVEQHACAASCEPKDAAGLDPGAVLEKTPLLAADSAAVGAVKQIMP